MEHISVRLRQNRRNHCDDEPMTDSNGTLRRVIGALPGSIAGALIGAVGGPETAALGAFTGTVLGEVGADVISRALSPRQERRVGTVLLAASAALTAQEQLHGRKARDDGFFADDTAPGARFVEGVLLTAKDAYEEQKVPYLGNLLAAVALDDGIDAGTANHALRSAEALSWNELLVLGVFADPGTYPMPKNELPPHTDWGSWTHLMSVKQLLDPPSSMLTPAEKTHSHGIPGFDLNLDAITLTNSGFLLTSLMSLTTIPDSDRRPVYNSINAAAASTTDG